MPLKSNFCFNSHACLVDSRPSSVWILNFFICLNCKCFFTMIGRELLTGVSRVRGSTTHHPPPSLLRCPLPNYFSLSQHVMLYPPLHPCPPSPLCFFLSEGILTTVCVHVVYSNNLETTVKVCCVSFFI